jgi:hypothetical protein
LGLVPMDAVYTIARMVADDFAIEKFNAEVGEYGFLDWFCPDSSLKQRAAFLLGKLKQVVQENAGRAPADRRFDPERTCVVFKNNYPLWASGTYDDLRICDAATDAVLFTISRQPEGHWEVTGRENGFERPLVSGTFLDVRLFFRAGDRGEKAAPAD